MQTPKTTPATGPEQREGDVPVHIIFVPLAAVSTAVIDGYVSTVTLKEVAKHIGAAAPHDIVVFAGQPFHFAQGELRAHPKVHHDCPETVVKLYRKRGERAVWWSERPFAITHITQEEPKNIDKAETPFGLPKTEPEKGIASGGIFVARSAVPDARADNQEYKITFTIEGESQPVDPNMYCDGN
jgi:hypothetical protein